MRRLPVLLILASLYILSLDILVAQSYTSTYWLEPWFLQARFRLTDQDDDGFVDKEELGFYEQEWRFFLIDEYYLESDLNGDNLLSEDEILSRVGTAHDFRIKEEGGMIRRLSFEYPYLIQAKPIYFKRHPEVAEILFENLTWVRNNPEMVQKLITDEAWLKKNPAVLRAFHRNLTALAEHPGQANLIYGYRLTQRQCSDQNEWRISHLIVLDEHRNILSKVLRLNLQDEQISDETLRNAKLAQSEDYRPILESSREDGNNELKEEAAQLEAELLVLIQRLQKENQALKAAEDLLRRQIQELRGALANVDGSHGQNELNLLRRKIAELSTSKSGLETQLNRLALDQRAENMSVSSAEVKNLRVRVNELSEENLRYQGLLSGNRDSLMMENIMQETQILQLHQVIVKMGAELDQRPEMQFAAGTNPAIPATDITLYKAEITRLKKQLETTGAENTRLSASLQQLSSRLDETTQTRSQLQDSFILLERQYEIEIQQLKQIVENRGEVEGQYEALSQQNLAQTQQIQAMTSTINALETQLAKQTRSGTNEATVQNLQQQYARQGQQNDSLVNANHALSRQLYQAQNKVPVPDQAALLAQEERMQKLQRRTDSLFRVNEHQTLQISQLRTQASQAIQATDQSAKIELEQKYLARLQRQRNQTDSLRRLNQELASQVDELQMAMIMDEPSDGQKGGIDPVAVEKMEQRYQTQIKDLQEAMKSNQTQGQFDASTINQLQQSFAKKLGEQTAQNRALISQLDSLQLVNSQQQLAALQANPNPDDKTRNTPGQTKAANDQIATLENKLKARDQEVMAAQSEIQTLQRRLEEKDQADAKLQEQTAELIAGEREQKDQLFDRMRDSLLSVQSSLKNQIYGLEMEQKNAAKQLTAAPEKEETPTSALESKLKARDQEVMAAQSEIQTLQRRLEEKDQAAAKLQEQTADLITGEREQKNQLFNRMRDSLLMVQNDLEDQIYALQNEKSVSSRQIPSSPAQAENELVVLQNQLRSRDQEVMAAQSEIQSLQGVIEEKSRAEEQLQERTMALLSSEREEHNQIFNQMRDSLLDLQTDLEDQIYALQNEKPVSPNQGTNQAANNPVGNAEQVRLELIEMELELELALAKVVEDSIMAISRRQLGQITQLEGERDTLVQEIRSRDRAIESYATKMKLQRDSLNLLLARQNRAFGALNSDQEANKKRSLMLQQQIAALEYDNEKMLERMESSISRNDELALEISKLRAHNNALSEKNAELKSRRSKTQNVVATTLQDQIEQLEQEKTNLAIEKKSITEQLNSLEDYISQVRQSETYLKREVQQQKSVNARLFNQIDSLENELAQFHSYNWPDSVSFYRRQLLIAQASGENQRGMNISQSQNYSQKTDSLRQALNKLRREIASIEQSNAFDTQRIRRLEEKEMQLNKRNSELLRQEELIQQQSRMIEGRLQSLSNLEKRYLDLLEREKQLQLLEQQLKQQPGYREAKRSLRGE